MAPQFKHHHVAGVEVVHKRDQANSISSLVGLTRYEDRPAAVIEEPKAKAQITGLLDILDLHLAGVKPSPGGLAVLLDKPTPEGLGALETLAECLDRTGIDILLREYDGTGWVPPRATRFDAADSATHYPNWPGYLAADFDPPSLLRHVIGAVGRPELRAYPQLTAPGWSLRLEGLEVGRVTETKIRLGVGKTSAAGVDGPIRQVWIGAVGTPATLEYDVRTVAEAAQKINAFASVWAETPMGQNEHALESRILRGAVPIKMDGRELALIRPDPAVNWGSQFPTKWGPGGRARYLDALLRDGDVPWAVEMKVAGSGGIGQYYRHAVAQAVLYREFIRAAKPLHFWFDQFHLDATKCEAAVVVPTPAQQHWHVRLSAMCEAFDVTLVTVDPSAASHSFGS